MFLTFLSSRSFLLSLELRKTLPARQSLSIPVCSSVFSMSSDICSSSICCVAAATSLYPNFLMRFWIVSSWWKTKRWLLFITVVV